MEHGITRFRIHPFEFIAAEVVNRESLFEIGDGAGMEVNTVDTRNRRVNVGYLVR